MIMISDLQVVWQQSAETYAVFRELLEGTTTEKLYVRPTEDIWSISDIAQHIARANIVYAMVMEGHEPFRREPTDRPSLVELLEYINYSETFVQEVFERSTTESLQLVRADDWNPLGPDVSGPLNSFWFALQIVRHTAYHVGQISYSLQLP